MPDLYIRLLRPLLFRLDAETAHRLVFLLAKAGGGLVPGVPEGLRAAAPREVFGIRFPNPIGLAAGMDKNAELLSLWKRMGFGFAEIGTVTPRPQPGNPRPRLFRLPQDRALLNRMGFNNDGAQAIARRLDRRPPGMIVGLNLGRNKDTPNAEAHRDYQAAFEVLQNSGDYAVLNVSSPNTPELRRLQAKEALERIITAVQDPNQRRQTPLPLLLKVAPELSPPELQAILDLAKTTGLAGLVATNTLLPTPEVLARLHTPALEVASMGAGGLSGPILHPRSPEMVRFVARQNFPVIGVGGIEDLASAEAHLQAGASLVQIYTGLVYQGPELVREILKGLLKDAEA